MKLIFRVVSVVLFIVFFGFALKNTQEATLRFFLDYEVRGPLILMLLSFFSVGAVLGVLAMTPTVLRHRRDLTNSRKLNEIMQKEQDAQRLARTQPPQPDAVISH
ncbi:LapA family protein [Noviherbaspirillum sp.]|uniref:LapA family protein n=1 Tax=Noviherbaspirillum sp. TaxID=1926288 RepID=UPI002FE3D419